MKPYEFLEHTADAKFRAYGKTLEEAFINCAYAMTDVITDHTKIKQTKEFRISVESEDEKALVYDFLEQFLILLDIKRFLLNEVKELKIEKKKDKFKLTAKVIGDLKPENYEINTTIKAVTYQEMFIKKEKDKYTIQVIVDI
jgi:SHS2 domain-containing protein